MDWAKKNNVEKILEVHLEVGEFTYAQPKFVRLNFKLMSKGTVVEGARIFIKKKPGMMACYYCGYVGKGKRILHLRMGIKLPSMKCPKCGEKVIIVQGNEYVLRKIKFKKKDSQLPEEVFYEG